MKILRRIQVIKIKIIKVAVTFFVELKLNNTNSINCFHDVFIIIIDRKITIYLNPNKIELIVDVNEGDVR